MNAESLLGTVLGTCTLQRLIGQGGMGAVYLAQQSRPRRQVAVKVLLPMVSLTPQQLAAFLERFRRETDAAASLEHPNIMPVHEYGEQNGLAYLVMPYISGGTLRDEMEIDGPLDLAVVANYLDQMAAAIDFAHEHAVIHRDIKPANILITPEKRLLLTDFGLVKILSDRDSPQIRLTGAGAPVGTPDYMAPEQIMGGPIDTRADLYSLGVVLYQMVTGMTPFQGEMPMQIAAQHLQSPPPPPRMARVDLPASAEQVMLRALAKRPEERYPRAQELASAFRLALATAGMYLGAAQTGTGVFTTPGATPTAGRLFTPRGLFDPGWQTGHQPSVNDHQTLTRQTGTQPAASPGLLSRTGMFPRVGATGHLPSAQPATTRQFPAASPFSTVTGKQAAMPASEIQQLSPVLNPQPGVMMVPNTDMSGQPVMKLTGPVKVVQVPVAGQPGRYITGLLPVVAPPQSPTMPQVPEKKAKSNRIKLISALLAVFIVLAGVAGFWLLKVHPIGSPATKTQATHVAGTPDLQATAFAQATATADANIILTDPLTRNIHSWPTNANEFFAADGYHIAVTGNNGMAVILAEKPFDMAYAYTLSMAEIKGDDNSAINTFGLIFRFNTQTKGNQRITTFYSFEVVNTPGGDYRFYKYDDSQGASASAWTTIWRAPFGSEFHQGQGAKNLNIFRVFQDGKNFTFSVNGKMIKTVQDGSLTGGTVGMIVNLNGTEVAFSNLLITRS